MSGWFKLHRGWMDSMDFAKEPFTEREAWLWLIENAAYEPHTRYVNGSAVELSRGDVLASQRTLGDVWKWGRQRVRGFIARLELLGSLTQNSTHGLTIITICNYAKYQDQQPSEQPQSNPAATQQQPIKEEGKEGKEGKELVEPDSGYAFSGAVIRLTEADFKLWQNSFDGIADLKAELTAIDAWLKAQDTAKRKAWFHSVPGMLNRKQQEIIAAQRQGKVIIPV